MKESLLLQAHYNALGDKTMFDMFFALEKDGKRELLYKDCGLFYSSISSEIHAQNPLTHFDFSLTQQERDSITQLDTNKSLFGWDC